MFKNLFKRKVKESEAEEELIPVPVPALIAVLINKEKEKAAPLTEQEVITIRDNAACIMMPVSVVAQMEESRGYPDIDPEYVWEHWQEARVELIENENT